LAVRVWPIVWPEDTTRSDVTLAYGQSVEGTLNEGEKTSWTFDGSEGDIISLGTQSGDNAQLDLTLDLIGPDGIALAQDDDSGPGLNPLVEGFSLPTSGVYTVEVTSRASSGSFTLILDKTN